MINRRAFYISVIWIVPVVLVLLESLIFLPKAIRNTDFLPYFVALWTIRAILAPLIVFYTFRFWVEHTRIIRIFLIHLLGFFLFSLLFWGISYLVLFDTLYQNGLFGLNENSNRVSVFAMIADNSISVNITVYVSTVFFCYVWRFFNRTIEANRKANELEKSLLVSRLELLKGQLNTHFLFNTLHTISSLVVRQQNDDANKILVRLSELLRFALRENKEQLITIEKEMELLQLYLDIQQTRFRERMHVNIGIDPALSNALIPALILQPLVENSVKYAIEPYRAPGKIDIDIRSVNGSLDVSVRDNGKIPFEKIDFYSGIGLTNTRERLRELYGEEHRFDITSNNGAGVRVNFLVPLQFVNGETAANSDR